MLPTALPAPGPVWGDYPERRASDLHWTDALLTGLMYLGDALRASFLDVTRLGERRWLNEVRAAQATLALMDEASAIDQVRTLLLTQGLTAPAILQSLALAAHLSRKHVQQQPFDTQLVAARAILDGTAAEMATGEGKTLAVGLAAAVGAFAGMPVHVVTANDYLVERDASQLRALYAAFGLSVASVTQATQRSERHIAYRCDVVYVTAKEVVFDYLRDGLDYRQARATQLRGAGRATVIEAPQRLLRGLCMAIVDEADAILIDEARIPLILSRPVAGALPESHTRAALGVARTLLRGKDFQIDVVRRTAELTRTGRALVKDAADQLAQASGSGVWRNILHREHAICTALTALHCYQHGYQYLVRDGAVQIIDENTGRVARGRIWSQGLHQFVEAKEGCALSQETETVAQLTYQRFFRRYVRLGGLSGTLREVRGELLSTYGLRTQKIMLRKTNRRLVLPTRLYADRNSLWVAVLARILDVHHVGRPVLVATESVADARHLAGLLRQCRLAPNELHARNDQDEARCVADAGRAGAITVTTNISGRGTDIQIDPVVAALGGLHIISCQLNYARRIDRQLAGRAGRRGDPGSVETMLSWDHPLLATVVPEWLRSWLCPARFAWVSRLFNPVLRWGLSLPQRAEERCHAAQRQRLMKEDERLERSLAFAGLAE